MRALLRRWLGINLRPSDGKVLREAIASVQAALIVLGGDWRQPLVRGKRGADNEDPIVRTFRAALPVEVRRDGDDLVFASSSDAHTAAKTWFTFVHVAPEGARARMPAVLIDFLERYERGCYPELHDDYDDQHVAVSPYPRPFNYECW